MSRFNPLLYLLGICLCAPLAAQGQTSKGRVTGPSVSAEGKVCVECHASTTPALVSQWKGSAHQRVGVDCFGCHKANADDPAIFEHYGQKIAVIVTPKYCARCHPAETKEFDASHHARAAQFIGSLDNILGNVVEGAPAAEAGCMQCHGSTVTYVGNGKFDPRTWPNSGIGRVNPDGSKGTCAACHGRHGFSAALARQPENCGKCHMGPDHPQAEIYAESKHGIQFRANINRMNLESKSWVVGKDYFAAPTCATCHMSATPNQPLTHDVGARISWTLRPVISVKLENWEKRREAMKDVCSNCHAASWVENFYQQYDASVGLYNEKFARPAKAIMDKLYAEGKLTKTPFDEELEWTFYLLWHHEGRRARMGASMMGPDFTQWHGFFEVAHHFYNEFLPQAEKLSPGITEATLGSDYHRWKKGLKPEDIQKTLDFYRERYKQ